MVAMGVFDGPDGGRTDDPTRPYVCMRCETTLAVQHHSCPACGGYDVRLAKWTDD